MALRFVKHRGGKNAQLRPDAPVLRRTDNTLIKALSCCFES